MVPPIAMNVAEREHTGDASLAQVIDLLPADQRADVRRLRQTGLGNELAADLSFLHAHYGDRFLDLPERLGRRLARAEATLGSGPIGIPATTAPADVVGCTRKATGAAAAMGELVLEEGQVLEDALSARLIDLPLDRLAATVDAVLGLAGAPQAAAAWAWPQAANAAGLVLDAHGDALVEGARLQEAVYAQFTDRVWDVPERRLRRGRERSNVVARFRLRRALTAVSRTSRAPSALAEAADLILEARTARAEVLAMSQVLESHLGDSERGVHTDVEAALAALTAVRLLQDALGDRLDAARLERLLAADAFHNDAVLEPARNLRMALRAWTADVAKLSGGDALATRGTDLTGWARLTEALLPDLEAAVAASERLATPAGGAPATLGELVNHLLARERLDEQRANLSPVALKATAARSAS